jgi:hypothetical protein
MSPKSLCFSCQYIHIVFFMTIIIWISSSIPCQGVIITEYSVPGCLFHHHISHKHEVFMHENCLLIFSRQKNTRWSKYCSQQPHRRIGFEVSKKKTLTYGIKDRRESNRRLLCWKLNLNCFSRIDTKILSKSLSSIINCNIPWCFLLPFSTFLANFLASWYNLFYEVFVLPSTSFVSSN